jgi:hypothetical protein
MRIARRLALGVLIAAMVRPGIASGQAPLQPPELSIVAPPAFTPIAKRIERLDRGKLISLMRAVGLDEAGPPITVMLVAEDEPLARRTRDWVAGLADSGSGVIAIFPSRTPPYPYDSVEALLHHEVAHILIGRAAPGAAIPRWFHEGLAMGLERTWGLRDRSQLALAVIGGRRSMAALDADFDGGAASAARAYGVAGAFVHDLIGRHGPEFPSRVLAALAAGATFDEAFGQVTAMSLAEAERRFWRDSWWYGVVPLLTSSLALWIAVVVLAVVARRRRAVRRRALRERWDAEERAIAAGGDALNP